MIIRCRLMLLLIHSKFVRIMRVYVYICMCVIKLFVQNIEQKTSIKLTHRYINNIHNTHSDKHEHVTVYYLKFVVFVLFRKMACFEAKRAHKHMFRDDHSEHCCRRCYHCYLPDIDDGCDVGRISVVQKEFYKEMDESWYLMLMLNIWLMEKLKSEIFV